MAENFANSLKNFSFLPGSPLEAALANGKSADATGAKGKRNEHLEKPHEGGKRKRVTKPKDPNAPKRPASSFLLFQNEVLKKVKEQRPDLPHAELRQLIAKMWADMGDEEKTVRSPFPCLICFRVLTCSSLGFNCRLKLRKGTQQSAQRTRLVPLTKLLPPMLPQLQQ